MRRSTDRILTTHTGSLPRPRDLEELLIAKQDGGSFDAAALAERVESATVEVVERQISTGIDVVSDGEQGKADYVDYVLERLTGFGGEIDPTTAFSFGDVEDLPEIVVDTWGDTHFKFLACEGEVAYTGAELVARDIALLKRAVGDSPVEAFLPAASPGVVAQFFPNRHYPSYEAYLFALAAALNTEYRAIVDAGLLLQVDAPDISFCSDFKTWMWPEVEKRGVRGLQELHVEAINIALEGVPEESVKMHLCYANYQGPHLNDQPIAEVLEPALKANVTAINFEAANPQHAHEWEIFEQLTLPDGKAIIPGVIDTKTQVVEHPRVVAQRIVRYAGLVGREQLFAGTDCGFGTAIGGGLVHPKVAWLKLKALAEGAAIASEELAAAPSGAR